MPIYNKSLLTLQINNKQRQALTINTDNLKLNNDYQFQIDVASETACDAEQWINQAACLQLGDQINIHGIVRQANFTVKNSSGFHYQLQLNSPLIQLQQMQKSKQIHIW